MSYNYEGHYNTIRRILTVTKTVDVTRRVFSPEQLEKTK